jgi:hypothetical protein
MTGAGGDVGDVRLSVTGTVLDLLPRLRGPLRASDSCFGFSLAVLLAPSYDLYVLPSLLILGVFRGLQLCRAPLLLTHRRQ